MTAVPWPADALFLSVVRVERRDTSRAHLVTSPNLPASFKAPSPVSLGVRASVWKFWGYNMVHDKGIRLK